MQAGWGSMKKYDPVSRSIIIIIVVAQNFQLSKLPSLRIVRILALNYHTDCCCCCCCCSPDVIRLRKTVCLEVIFCDTRKTTCYVAEHYLRYTAATATAAAVFSVHLVLYCSLFALLLLRVLLLCFLCCCSVVGDIPIDFRFPDHGTEGSAEDNIFFGHVFHWQQ